jgi:hypothetical protein
MADVIKKTKEFFILQGIAIENSTKIIIKKNSIYEFCFIFLPDNERFEISFENRFINHQSQVKILEMVQEINKKFMEIKRKDRVSTFDLVNLFVSANYKIEKIIKIWSLFQDNDFPCIISINSETYRAITGETAFKNFLEVNIHLLQEINQNESGIVKVFYKKSSEYIEFPESFRLLMTSEGIIEFLKNIHNQYAFNTLNLNLSTTGYTTPASSFIIASFSSEFQRKLFTEESFNLKDHSNT